MPDMNYQVNKCKDFRLKPRQKSLKAVTQTTNSFPEKTELGTLINVEQSSIPVFINICL